MTTSSNKNLEEHTTNPVNQMNTNDLFLLKNDGQFIRIRKKYLSLSAMKKMESDGSRKPLIHPNPSNNNLQTSSFILWGKKTAAEDPSLWKNQRMQCNLYVIFIEKEEKRLDSDSKSCKTSLSPNANMIGVHHCMMHQMLIKFNVINLLFTLKASRTAGNLSWNKGRDVPQETSFFFGGGNSSDVFFFIKDTKKERKIDPCLCDQKLDQLWGAVFAIVKVVPFMIRCEKIDKLCQFKPTKWSEISWFIILSWVSFFSLSFSFCFSLTKTKKKQKKSLFWD